MSAELRGLLGLVMRVDRHLADNDDAECVKDFMYDSGGRR